jgi:DNA-binding beta-propeller fold protein YncE
VSFPLDGGTVAGYGNGSSGSANNALNNPWGLAVGTNDTLYVSDTNNNRVMKFQAVFRYLNQEK